MGDERAGLDTSMQPQHGNVAVRVSPDCMEAYLTVTPSRYGGHPVTVGQALQALAKAGVTYGVHTQTVEQLVEDSNRLLAHESAKKPAAVAKGKESVRGQDAVITPDEWLQTPSGYPRLKEDGTVDFFELSLVRNVQTGRVLATRQPPTRGTPGINVLGAVIPSLDGKDMVLRAGKGCRVTEDGLSIVAEIAGHAIVGQDGKVLVNPVYEVRGDVDTSTGNIDFVGTVVVHGNVNSGFVVKAEQNVEVHGGIDCGTVMAGGDLTVAYGIQGAGRGQVVAGGSIRCRFMENAEARCGRDLTVSDGILHSRVRSGGKVTVTGRRGSIIGGQVKAKDEISARILGSSLAASTELEVGMAPELRDELEMVRRSLAEAEEGLRKAIQAVGLLRELEARKPAGFSPEKKEMLMKSLRSQFYFQGQRDQLVARKAVLDDQMQISHQGRIKASDTAYPGVRVLIGNETYQVIDSLRHVTFYLSEQREVTLGSA